MNRWDELKLSEKAQLLGIYVSKGYTDLASIISHYNTFQAGGPVKKESNYSVGRVLDGIYRAVNHDEFMGEPSHKYQFIKPEYVGLSEEELDSLIGQADERGHRLDVVKAEAHPSHYSRGTWSGNDFELTDKGLAEVNHTYFGLNDGGQDPQARLTYKGSVVLPEITITPDGAYIYNTYDNRKLHLKQQGGSLGKITPYGQWQYPHQITTIPSNNITMKGVDYPVIGVSNTGDTKYMLPNMDYLFEGQYVTEYPVHKMQKGGYANEPNFVGGATALKKDYNYELEHLADKYAVTESGPWHDYGIHNPSPSQRTHWNELSRMYNRVAQRPNYQRLNPINIAEYTPVVGDAIDAGYSLYDLQQGNIGLGLAGLGMLALPNIIEKPLGKITRRIAPTVDKNAVSTYWDRFSNRVRQKYGDDVLEKIDFIQSNTPEDKRIASNILERKAEAMSKEYNIGTKEDWLKTIAQKVKTPGFSLPETSTISTRPVVYTTNNPYIYSREAANKRFGEAINKFGYDVTQHNLIKPHETAHILPEATESLTDDIFDLTDISNYFIKNNFDEVKARGTQLKDYFNSDRLTGDMLKYAAENYSKDTGIKNNMKYMFNRIKDWDKMAKWMTKYSPAIALPIVATASQED